MTNNTLIYFFILSSLTWRRDFAPPFFVITKIKKNKSFTIVQISVYLYFFCSPSLSGRTYTMPLNWLSYLNICFLCLSSMSRELKLDFCSVNRICVCERGYWVIQITDFGSQRKRCENAVPTHIISQISLLPDAIFPCHPQAQTVQ